MKKNFFLIICIFGAALPPVIGYKLCTTFEHEPLCKWIEASRKEITCVRVLDSVDCILKMKKKEADFGAFSSEEAFLAARFLGEGAVILAEVRHPDRVDSEFYYQTVAVVHSKFSGGLSALKGASYCHPGFSKAQYWSDRVLKNFEKRVMDHFNSDIKCNSAKRSAYEDDLYRLSTIFSKACRPGIWAVGDWWDKKLKRDYKSLCSQCEHPNTCSYKVQNKGKHSDALRCLTLRGGNVTYTALEFVKEYFELNSDEFTGPEYKNPNQFSFLCPDGTTRPITSSDSCSWIKQPWPSVIALSSDHNEILQNLKIWLDSSGSSDSESKQTKSWTVHLKKILAKDNGILQFKDEPLSVSNYIKRGRNIPNIEREGLNGCRKPIRWCTISPKESKKCEYVATAALTHGLPTNIICVEGSDKINCMKKIRNNEADFVYIDSELGYISRKVYNLTAAAFLETQRTGNYYGVIAMKGDSFKNFKSLKGKRACFPQYQGLGWQTFAEAMKSESLTSDKACSNSGNILRYFSKSCAPGATNPMYNFEGLKIPVHLCQGCGNVKNSTFCEDTFHNPYYGEIGALKCLNEGHGDVAFLNFYTIQKFLNSRSEDLKNSKINPEDFKILCKNGSIETFNMTDPDKCSYTQYNGGEVVTRNNLDPVRKTDIFTTLIELDDLFGITSRNYDPAIKIFEPFDGEPALLFAEAAVSLVSVYETQNSFVNNYVKVLNTFENCVIENGSSVTVPSVISIILSIFLCRFLL